MVDMDPDMLDYYRRYHLSETDREILDAALLDAQTQGLEVDPLRIARALYEAGVEAAEADVIPRKTIPAHLADLAAHPSSQSRLFELTHLNISRADAEQLEGGYDIFLAELVLIDIFVRHGMEVAEAWQLESDLAEDDTPFAHSLVPLAVGAVIAEGPPDVQPVGKPRRSGKGRVPKEKVTPDTDDVATAPTTRASDRNIAPSPVIPGIIVGGPRRPVNLTIELWDVWRG
jgi:hypothetical protein